jgi:hypothetical protein
MGMKAAARRRNDAAMERLTERKPTVTPVDRSSAIVLMGMRNRYDTKYVHPTATNPMRGIRMAEPTTRPPMPAASTTK